MVGRVVASVGSHHDGACLMHVCAATVAAHNEAKQAKADAVRRVRSEHEKTAAAEAALATLQATLQQQQQQPQQSVRWRSLLCSMRVNAYPFLRSYR